MFVKKHKVLSTIICLFLLFVISLGGTIAIANATRAKDVTIPNIVGKTAEEAKQILKNSKLNYVEAEPIYNTEFEAGQIISQDPKDGLSRKENTDVKVVISLGTEKTTVPVLKGLTKEEAEKTAKDSKIKLEIIEEISKTVEAGVIIKQDTESETEVNAGDTVVVYVSMGTGIKQVLVSSVLYKEEAVAKQILEEDGLVVEVEYDEDKTRGNGVVLRQSITSGEIIDEGTTITITVNKLAELKQGTVIINVKSLTGYQDKITTTEEKTDDAKKDEVTEGEETTENKETSQDKKNEKNNTPKDVKLEVKVDDDIVASTIVKENVTDKKVNFDGKGTVTIKVIIDGVTKKKVDMDLNKTTSLVIE